MRRPRRVMRRRRVARAAVIGGVAYHAGKRGVQAGQQEQEEAQYETSDQAPAPEAARDPIEQIKELSELRAQGILTDEEFTAEKKKLLGI
jgi:Short C-terminal domain